MSRLIAIACALALVFLMAVPAFAAKPNLTFNTKLSVTTDGATVELPRNSKAGFRLDLGGDPAVEHILGMHKSRANPGLADGSYPFFLDVDAATQADLVSYFDAKGWPAEWYPRINAQIAGTEPFFWLKAAGDEYSIVDGFKLWLGQVDPPLVINDDYPLGTYVYEGTLTASNDAALDVVIKLTLF